MTVIESRRLRPGDRVRHVEDGAIGTVVFCNWTHVRIKWDDDQGIAGSVRHEDIARALLR